MISIIRLVIFIVVALVPALPAAAQRADIDREIDRQVERIVLAFRLDDQGRRGGRAGDRGPQGPEVTENFSRTARLDRNGTFDLQNIAGNVVVTGGGGNDVRIDAVKRVRGRDNDDARRLLQEIQIDVREQSNRIEVRTEYPRNERNLRGAAVEYTVALPQDSSVVLRTISGDVRVTNVRGELSAQSVSGNITASDVLRVASVKSVSGDIQLTNAGSDASFDGSTVSGDLTAKGLKVRTLEFTSVSGDVLLDNVETERASLRSVSGTIDYAGALARNGRYELNSHSGALRVSLAGSTGFTLEANTFSGGLRSDFDLRINEIGRSRGRNRPIRGSFGDGSAMLSLSSFSGDIVVSRR
jgi:hypothetical protein